jgi:hypothetical protein
MLFLVFFFNNFILITTELPISLVYSYRGYVQPQNDQFCSFGVAYNYGLYDVGLFLMDFGSIERYFLIFHERFAHKWCCSSSHSFYAKILITMMDMFVAVVVLSFNQL